MYLIEICISSELVMPQMIPIGGQEYNNKIVCYIPHLKQKKQSEFFIFETFVLS